MCARAGKIQEQPANTTAGGRSSRHSQRTSNAAPPSKATEHGTAEPIEAGAAATEGAGAETAAVGDAEADVEVSKHTTTHHDNSSQRRSSRAGTTPAVATAGRPDAADSPSAAAQRRSSRAAVTAAAATTGKPDAVNSPSAAAGAAAATAHDMGASIADAVAGNGAHAARGNGHQGKGQRGNGHQGRSSGSSKSSVRGSKAASQAAEAAPSRGPLSEATTAVTAQPALERATAPAATPGSQLAARIGTGLQSLQVRVKNLSGSLWSSLVLRNLQVSVSNLFGSPVEAEDNL